MSNVPRTHTRPKLRIHVILPDPEHQTIGRWQNHHNTRIEAMAIDSILPLLTPPPPPTPPTTHPAARTVLAYLLPRRGSHRTLPCSDKARASPTASCRPAPQT